MEYLCEEIILSIGQNQDVDCSIVPAIPGDV
jgi:hypothetical protein